MILRQGRSYLILNPSPLDKSLSLPGKNDRFSGKLELRIQVSNNDPLVDTTHAEKSMGEMKEGPEITAPFPGYGELVNTVIDQTNAWQVLIDRLDRLDGVVKALDALANVCTIPNSFYRVPLTCRLHGRYIRGCH